ncbi:MAG: hypothetical protein K6G52_03255 [Treponemataceae bacterium]|nr:hypothetical protein [Treponemataceae bacterium]
MKKINSIKRILSLILVLSMAFGIAFAKEKKDEKEISYLNRNDNLEILHPKYERPARKDIVVVGRIVVEPTEDMEFYFKTRDVLEEKMANNDLYRVNYQTYIYSSDEFFYATIEKPKKRDGDELDFTVPFTYYIHGSNKLSLYLPINFTFDVSDDTQYVYLGTMVVTTIGDDFTVKSIDNVDEYDDALKFLQENVKTKKEIILERANYKF